MHSNFVIVFMGDIGSDDLQLWFKRSCNYHMHPFQAVFIPPVAYPWHKEQMIHSFIVFIDPEKQNI